MKRQRINSAIVAGESRDGEHRLLTAEEEAAMFKAGDLEGIYRHNVRLATSIAKSHAYFGLDFDDVFSLCKLHLWRAVQKFQVSRGFKFSTYATYVIRNGLKRDLAVARDLIKVPVCKAMRDTKAAVDMRERLSRMEKVYPGLPAKLANHSLDLQDMARCLKRIDERTQTILQLRFQGEMTLEEIGGIVGVSKERVRQIQNAGLARLRAMMEGQG